MTKIDEQFIGNRITQLREWKAISERKMSLDLGHSPSYIHSIVCGRALPSMSEFLYICEYLGVTPMEFFDDGQNASTLRQRAIDYIRTMPDSDVELFLKLFERIRE